MVGTQAEFLYKLINYKIAFLKKKKKRHELIKSTALMNAGIAQGMSSLMSGCIYLLNKLLMCG